MLPSLKHSWPTAQCCRSRSGIRCIFDPWIQNPGSGIGFFRIPHIFESLMTIFWVKSSIILWKLGQIFFFSLSKIRYFKILWNLWLQIKVWQQTFIHASLLLLFLDPRSRIQDSGSGMAKIQDPESGINILDPQHCHCPSLPAKVSKMPIKVNPLAYCICGE